MTTSAVVTDFFDALADHLADRVAEKIKGPQPTASSKPISTLAAAAALGVSGRSLIRWADEQGCPCIRTAGGKRRWDIVAVKQWLDARDGNGGQP